MKTEADRSQGARQAAALFGFDLVRLIAMGCVVIQHVLSIGGPEPGPFLGCFGFGDLGVTLFCALSGYLALRPGKEPPLRWLSRRISRILIPYWITQVVVFATNEIIHYKPVSPGLVVAQLLGIAYFTHKSQLLGIPFWFVSLILPCYVIAAIIRWDRRLLPVFVLAAVALIPVDPFFIRHILSFLAGAIVASAPKAWIGAVGVATACLAATLVSRAEYAYPLAGTLSVLVGMLIPGKSPRVIAQASQSTYEFYLVHGPIFLGVSMASSGGYFTILIVGTFLSSVAAFLLKRLTVVVEAAWTLTPVLAMDPSRTLRTIDRMEAPSRAGRQP